MVKNQYKGILKMLECYQLTPATGVLSISKKIYPWFSPLANKLRYYIHVFLISN